MPIFLQKKTMQEEDMTYPFLDLLYFQIFSQTLKTQMQNLKTQVDNSYLIYVFLWEKIG